MSEGAAAPSLQPASGDQFCVPFAMQKSPPARPW
jgi:hypothetical protein